MQKLTILNNDKHLDFNSNWFETKHKQIEI